MKIVSPLAPAVRFREHRCGIFTVDAQYVPLWTKQNITYVPVRDNIWTVSNGIYRTIFVEGETGLIAFDTFETPGAARSFKRVMQRTFPHKPIHTIVYSHDHIDHSGYASEMSETADILAHRLCDAVVRARRAPQQRCANEVWEGEYRNYVIDGVEMEMFYPGPTHGDGNIAIYFPGTRVLFMVDNVQTGIGYTFFPDHHVEPYTGNMRRLLELDFDIFIPGHFWLMSRDDYCNSLNLFDCLAEDAKLALIDGCDIDDLVGLDRWAHDKLAARYERQFRFHEYIAQNIMRFMHHHLTGGWGVDGAAKPVEGRIHRCGA